MRIVFGVGKINKIKRSVVVLGVFDGLHLGHLRILKAAIRYARKIKGKTVVVTFNPHPQSESMLYSLEHRISGLRKIGIDICIVVQFTKSFAKISASDFIRKFLIKKLHPDCVFVGENFTFGRNAQGNPQLLLAYAKQFDFRLKTFPVYKLRQETVSSTSIRKLIINGELRQAEKLLGRPVSILGTVIKGKGLARIIGFPTANIKAHHEVLPPPGVYSVKINFKNKKFQGICYIGSKPTLKITRFTQPEIGIEVHMFNFSNSLYGKDLEVQFIKRIRKEKKFSGLGLLTQQIKKDIQFAKSSLK